MTTRRIEEALACPVGGFVALLASVFDMLDGRVARMRGRETKAVLSNVTALPSVVYTYVEPKEGVGPARPGRRP